MSTEYKTTLHPSVACLILALALSPLASADSVSSVSCATPSASFSTGTRSCNAVGLYGYAEASASSSVVLPLSINQAAQIDTNSSVSALLGGVRGISPVSTASSSNDIALNFDTAGSAQAGFLELTFLQNQSIPTGGLASEQLIIGSYTLNPDGKSITSLFIPIELGTEFSFNFLDSLIVNADSATGAITGRIGVNISLQAFAADKTTPVQLFDPPVAASAAPEPSSIGMLAIATLALLTLMTKSRV